MRDVEEGWLIRYVHANGANCILLWFAIMCDSTNSQNILIISDA